MPLTISNSLWLSLLTCCMNQLVLEISFFNSSQVNPLFPAHISNTSFVLQTHIITTLLNCQHFIVNDSVLTDTLFYGNIVLHLGGGKMSSVSNRFKEARKKLGLSQIELGEKLGVNRSVIANIELDRLKNPQQKDPLFKLFCKECGINYLWLMEGVGKPISEFPKTVLDDLANTYKLSSEAKELVKRFINMPEEKRKVITELFAPIKKDED